MTDASWGDVPDIEVTEFDVHDVEPQSWADVYQPEPGVVVLDAGYGDEWIESDCVVEVRE